MMRSGSSGTACKEEWNPLLRLSQRAQERSGRLAGMEEERKSLEERLRTSEAASARLRARPAGRRAKNRAPRFRGAL